MKKSLLSLSLICAVNLSASLVIEPKEKINFFTDSLSKPSYSLQISKTYNPDESYKWHYARYFEGDTKDDLYLRSIDIANNKMIAAGSYHSSLLVYDLKNDEISYNDFYAIKDADHGQLGQKYPEAEQDVKEQNNSNDEWSGASELFVEQSEFINKNEAYVNTMPKYLGRDNKDARPYLHHAGLHKVQINDDLSIKTLNFAKGEFYVFFKSKNGVIALGDNGNFNVFDKNLKLLKTFKIDNLAKATFENERLFVLIKGDKKGIYEYDIKKSQLKKIANFNEQFFGRPIKPTTSAFFASKDAKNIYYTTPHEHNSKLCKVDIKKGKTECTNTGLTLYANAYAISPDSKFVAITGGDKKSQISLFNVEKSPYLAGYAKGGVVSYAAAFKDNKTLAVSNERRMISFYDIKKGSKITSDAIFDDLKTRIFDFVAKDMNKIAVKVKKKGGKEKIVSDLNLPSELYGINLTWELPDEFKDCFDAKKRVFTKLPSTDLSGVISVKMELINNGKVQRSETINSDFALKVKR